MHEQRRTRPGTAPTLGRVLPPRGLSKSSRRHPGHVCTTRAFARLRTAPGSRPERKHEIRHHGTSIESVTDRPRCSGGFSRKPPANSVTSTGSLRFTCETAYSRSGSRSGAGGMRTPDLRRAKATRHFAGPLRSLQNSCKQAYFYSIAFPVVSGGLLGLLHGCCTGRRRSPTCIGSRNQRQHATWALLIPCCLGVLLRLGLHGGA